ncbi:hypothetical protein [uncultured Ruminococcus sp.]|uniref:hypothetical protein n=1 Tax=uncultured Ruminococcus sp. TaxID=165186 RepID=UPI0025E1EAEE|nr:hypothetical protein [uncultured Ruminococcus sp.]
MWDFIKENWSNIFLIIVTASALLVYLLQERRKITEAAALIKMQIDELQNGIVEIDSYIVDGKLNFTAFYESHQLFSEDYWSKYKHYFVKRIDAKDFGTISKLYEYASEIQEQQVLMKNLQKNFFFVCQQNISNLETTEVLKTINFQNNVQLVTDYQAKLKEAVTSELDEETAQAVTEIIQKATAGYAFPSNPNSLTDNRQLILNLVNQQYFTTYSPLQIKLSLEKYIKKYSLLEIDGTDGYKTIKKISERRF